MKRLSLAILFACCTLAISAQESIRVNYQGAKPDISDFVWAFVTSRDNDEDEESDFDESFNAFKQAWIQHCQGIPLDEGETVTVDKKNGYVVYESKMVDGAREEMLKVELCYWNEADGKHKLFAYNVRGFTNGRYSPGQFDGLTFFRYNNATKKMTMTSDTGFDEEYGTEDGAYISYTLPRVGKDIIVTKWYNNGRKTQKTLKWKGRRFSY